MNNILDNTVSHITSILSQVQRVHNTSTGYEVRTTTHTDSNNTVTSTTSVYTVYDRSLRIQTDPYARSGTHINTVV